MKKILLLVILLLSLSACAKKMTREEFKATLDAMVKQTLSAVETRITSTPTRTSTMTPNPPMPTFTPTLSPSATYTPTITPTPRGVLACLQRYNAANVRSKPSEDSPRVATISKNQCITLLAVTPDQEWGRMDRGWITIRFFEVSGPISNLPVESE
jgi:uncharacterized protein YgiM (DUF1202 family)